MTYDGRIQADARHLPIADCSVQCCVTSPPYFGLRDYGNQEQVGIERTPEEYVDALVSVFREVRRVLNGDGTAWLNLGDSYANDAKWGGSSGGKHVSGLHGDTGIGRRKQETGLKPKDLVGIPWRVAFALQADGWYLRRDIIWHKPNPMPESVTDRPTTAHEYIFLLSKSERYFYDGDAIREPYNEKSIGRYAYALMGTAPTCRQGDGDVSRRENEKHVRPPNPLGRNRRSVWTVTTGGYKDAHYSTFPEEIPEICIKAGSRPGDVILDPFFGSGTVGRVAERLSRRWVGVDLGYQDLQEKQMRNLQREFV